MPLPAALKLDRQSVFEAVEIQDTIFKAELTAKLRAQPTIPQESPRGLFGFRWGPSQLANSRCGDSHGAIISAHKYPPVPNGAAAVKTPVWPGLEVWVGGPVART